MRTIVIHARAAGRAALMITALAVLVAGCAPASDDAGGLPAKNIDLWVMPLDTYNLGYRGVSDYAQALLVAPCMKEAGYSFDVPWFDINAGPPATRSQAMRRLFDESIARQWGYHDAPSKQPNAEAMSELNSRKLDDAASAQFRTCLGKAREVLPVPPGSVQVSNSMASAALAGAMADATVVAAAARWRECMAPQGVSDLPDTPTGMPTDELRTRFGMTGDGGSGSITAEERQLAVADARCRESSGYREALYDAEWDREVTQLRENADALTRAKSVVDTYDATALKVINERGGS